VKVPRGDYGHAGRRKYAEVKVTDFKVNSGIQLQELQRRPWKGRIWRGPPLSYGVPLGPAQ